MGVELLPLDHQGILNLISRQLSRTAPQPRHQYGQYSDPLDPRARFCEPWRFPAIGSFRDPATPDLGHDFNRVTFVFRDPLGAIPGVVAVGGTFGSFQQPVALERLPYEGSHSIYRAVAIKVPKGQVHTYTYYVDGVATLDPINPQRTADEAGNLRSRFFTALCTQPLSFNRWQYALMSRLTDHILPLRTAAGRKFLGDYYNHLGRQQRNAQYPRAFRLDEPVGVVNFIDKLLAREEAHHLIDYRICLGQLASILKRRYAMLDPSAVPREEFADLYDQMANNSVNGWDYTAYNEPAYFLKLLRRHSYTGAFSHPRHGGNAGAAGWAYLEETCRGPANESCFNWRHALEAPIGLNPEYFG